MIRSVLRKGFATLNTAASKYGFHILHGLPHGHNLEHDLGRSLPSFKPAIIFDVGAHVGQSAGRFTRTYPSAEIWCFEPSVDSFSELLEATRGNRRIVCERLAIGDRDGVATFIYASNASMSHLSTGRSLPNGVTASRAEDVNVTTLDAYSDRAKISQIDILKVDTEGHDLRVLQGASRLLSESAIGIVETEVGMNPGNTFHAPLALVSALLERHGYRIFGVYSQSPEWTTNEPVLRRANVAFISPQLAPRA